MLVLFDQGTPVPLRQFLREHTVRTAAEQGWTTLGNGELLDAAEAGDFHVIVTTDKNMRHQQKREWSQDRDRCPGTGAVAVAAAQPGTFSDVDMPDAR